MNQASSSVISDKDLNCLIEDFKSIRSVRLSSKTMDPSIYNKLVAGVFPINRKDELELQEDSEWCDDH